MMPMTVLDLHRSPLTSDETLGYDGVLLVVSRRPNGPSSLTDVASNPASTEASFADSWRLGDANRTVWSLDSRRSGILQSFALLSANLLASEAVQLGGRSTSTDPFIDPGQRQLYVDQGKAENPAWPHVLVHLSREVDKHEQGCATMVESVSHFVGEGKSWPRATTNTYELVACDSFKNFAEWPAPGRLGCSTPSIPVLWTEVLSCSSLYIQEMIFSKPCRPSPRQVAAP